MTLSRTLSGWVMRVATRRPPPAQAEWARAMQCEFATMERGGLSWALGCLTTRLGWFFRAQWLYLLLLALVPFGMRWINSLEFDFFTSSDGRKAFFHDYLELIGLIEPLPLAIVLGFYRPNRIGTTLVLGCLLAQHVCMTLYASYIMGVPFFRWFGPHATLYMAPPLVGICASLWVWYFGASFGARLARRHAARAG